MGQLCALRINPARRGLQAKAARLQARALDHPHLGRGDVLQHQQRLVTQGVILRNQVLVGNLHLGPDGLLDLVEMAPHPAHDIVIGRRLARLRPAQHQVPFRAHACVDGAIGTQDVAAQGG
jgi:hypothetical protein